MTEKRAAYQKFGDLYKDLAFFTLRQGDYSSAMYLFDVAEGILREAGNPEAAEEVRKQFMPKARKGMLVEFRRIAVERGLVVNDDNFYRLLEEHSPSYNSYAKMTRMLANLEGSLQQGLGSFRRELRNMIEDATAAIKGVKDAEYLAGNLEAIMEWEEWKEEPAIDLEACYSGLATFSNEDLMGEHKEEESMIRLQLDRIKRFREECQ